MSIQCSACNYQNLDNAVNCKSCGELLQSTFSIDPLHLPPETTLAGGKYKIIKTLGVGGFAITYKGIDTITNNIIAIKERFPEKKGTRQGKKVLWGIMGGIQRQQEAVDKFEFEGQILKQCTHKSIVHYYDYFEENNTSYIIMDFIDGKSLYDIVNKNGALGENIIKQYFLQLAEALKEVHSQTIDYKGVNYTGILHRDIKPENIMIDAHENRAILIDFGIARGFDENITKTDTVMVSYAYAPVEQYVSNAKRTASADLYSLSASMYYAITGKIPPNSVDRLDSIRNKNTELLQSPSQLGINISPEMEEILLTGMEIDIQKRFFNAEQLIEYLKGNPVPKELFLARNFVRQAQGRQSQLEEAVKKYENILNSHKDNFNALVELAQIFIHLERIQEAKTYAEKAIKFRPNDGNANGVLGIICCHEKQWQEAVQYLEKSAKITPKKSWIQLNFALALGKTKQWQQAEQVLENALQLSDTQQDDNFAFAKGLQSWININQQQWKEAITTARQGISRTKSTNLRNAQKLQYWIYPCLTIAIDNYLSLSGKQTQDLSRCLDEFSNQLPDTPFIDGYRGWQFAMQGSSSTALSLFKKAATKNKVSGWIFLNLAILYEHNGDITNAINVYETYLKNDQNNPIILFRLGTLIAQQKQWEKAFERLEKATLLKENYAEAFHNKGWILLNMLKCGSSLPNQTQNDLYEKMKFAYKKAIELYKQQQKVNLADLIQKALPFIIII